MMLALISLEWCYPPITSALLVYAVCQTLRILSFSSTQLPSPNYHCRLPELTAIKDMPLHWWGHFIVDLGRQASLFSTFSSSCLDCSKTASLHAGLLWCIHCEVLHLSTGPWHAAKTACCVCLSPSLLHCSLE